MATKKSSKKTKEQNIKSFNPVLFFCICAAVMMLIAIIYMQQALTGEHLNYALPFVGYGGTFKDMRAKGGFSLYWAAHIVGIIGMSTISYVRRKEIGINTVQAVLTGVLLAVFGFIGAKLLYIVENLSHVLKYGITLGGVSFFGTVFFMPLAIPLIALILRIKSKDYIDFCTPAGVLMLAFIRMGCFMQGCCGGLTIWISEKPFIFPVQLLECSLDFLLIAILFTERIRERFKHGLYFLFMGGYGTIRILMEFMRKTPKDENMFTRFAVDGSVGRYVLSDGQIFSIICILICVIYMIYKNKKGSFTENHER